MSANFKSCLFGGFDKQDVIAFIDKTAQETNEKIAGLEKENGELRERGDKLDTELAVMRQDYAEKSEKAEEAVVLAEKLEDAECRLQELEKRCAELQVLADEYQGVKDHIAEIEISAHRRTEQFRAEAIAKLREIISAQNTWCAETSARYAALNATVVEQLHQAQEAVADPDFSCFDDMTHQLQALSESFDEPEKKEEPVVEEVCEEPEVVVEGEIPVEEPVEEIAEEETPEEPVDEEELVVEHIAAVVEEATEELHEQD